MTAVEVVGCPEAEAAVLGCLLRLPADRAGEVVEHLAAADFTDPRNMVVFEAVVMLVEADVAPDPVTVLGELRRAGSERSFTCDRSAGVYLTDLLQAAPAVVNVGHYTRVVVEHAARRRLVEAAQRLEQVAGTADLSTVLAVVRAEYDVVLEQLDRVAAEPVQVLR